MISKNPFYISGRKKFEAQDFEGALADYTKAIEQEEDPFLYSERGVVYYHLNNLAMSLKDMDYAATLEPENPYRYSSRAYIKDAMGDINGGIADYERAIQLDPDDSIAHNNLGLLQEKLGYKEKAKRNFDRADSLEGIDKMIGEIRKEEKEKATNEHKSQSEVKAIKVTSSSRKSLSTWALLRNTFTTETGFKEYLAFIKNGFKPRK